MSIRIFFHQMATFGKGDGKIDGLKYVPTAMPFCGDDVDYFIDVKHPAVEFSKCNQSVLSETLASLNPRCIVEIGVNRNPDYSKTSTSILIDNKPKDCFYIGIDIDDKSNLNNAGNKVYTLQMDSSAHYLLFELLESLGISEIDLLMIDGYHSVNQCVLDWQYTMKLSKNGVVVLHDSNYHPGPSLLYESIDENLYDKAKQCIPGTTEEETDWGIAIARRKS